MTPKYIWSKEGALILKEVTKDWFIYKNGKYELQLGRHRRNLWGARGRPLGFNFWLKDGEYEVITEEEYLLSKLKE